MICHFTDGDTESSGSQGGRSTPPVVASSGQEWQFHISTVRAHIGRSTGRSTPPIVASSGQEWQFHITTVKGHIGRASGRSTGRSPPQVVASSWSRMSNFTFLLLELTWVDQVADRLADLLHWYWHLVVKNSNFTFLLLELIVADLLADLLPQYWHLVVKHGNLTFLLLELILVDQVARSTPLVVASSGQEW